METDLAIFALVALGGGLGSMARAALAAGLGPLLTPAGAIFVINAVGSFAIGAALGAALETAALRDMAPPGWFTFFAVGLLGGFTTVSTYALQVGEAWQAGRRRAALANALGSVVLCPALAALGVGMVLLARGLV